MFRLQVIVLEMFGGHKIDNKFTDPYIINHRDEMKVLYQNLNKQLQRKKENQIYPIKAEKHYVVKF